MLLSDVQIRNAKPTSKPYKLADGGGLYVLVKPDGAKYWRLKYRFAGKEKLLALGVYPLVRAPAARTARDEAKRLANLAEFYRVCGWVLWFTTAWIAVWWVHGLVNR